MIDGIRFDSGKPFNIAVLQVVSGSGTPTRDATVVV